MDYKKLAKKLTAKGLPLIGTALAGSVGGTVAEMITGVLGLDDSADEDEIIKKIEADPEALLKLKELQINKELELKRLSISEDQMYLIDTQDARKAQIQRQEQTGKPDYNLYILAWMNVLGFFVVIGILMYATLPTGTDKILYMLLGVLASTFSKVNQYFFGSSKGSSEKTKLLYNGK